MKKLYPFLVIPSIVYLVALSLELGLTCDNLLAYLIYPLGFVVSVFATVAGIVISLRSDRRNVPFAVLCVAVMGAYMLVPSVWNWRQSIEFNRRRAGYMEVIDLVRQGYIEPGDSSLAELPSAYQYLLPCTSQIAIEENDRELFVLFFASNGIFGEFTGYMYVSDDRSPSVQQFRELRRLRPDHWSRIEQVETNWFYVVWDH